MFYVCVKRFDMTKWFFFCVFRPFWRHDTASRVLFRSKKFLDFDTVALSFLFENIV